MRLPSGVAAASRCSMAFNASEPNPQLVARRKSRRDEVVDGSRYFMVQCVSVLREFSRRNQWRVQSGYAVADSVTASRLADHHSD